MAKEANDALFFHKLVLMCGYEYLYYVCQYDITYITNPYSTSVRKFFFWSWFVFKEINSILILLVHKIGI